MRAAGESEGEKAVPESMSKSKSTWISVSLSFLLAGCPVEPSDDPRAGAHVLMDFDGAFWDAPFPSAHRVVGGVVDIEAWPRPVGIPFVDKLFAAASRMPGFAQTGAIFLPMDGAPDGRLPSYRESLGDDAHAFLVGLDGPDRGRRVPVEVRFIESGGPFSTDSMLSMLPLQGRPLAPSASYAAVVMRDLGSGGARLARAEAIDALRDGRMSMPTYSVALDELLDQGLDVDAIAGLAVFRTQDAAAGLVAATAYARSEHALAVPGAITLRDVFDDYCVFDGLMQFPVFQAGEPPYLGSGGGWQWEDGVPVWVRDEPSRVVVTVPRSASEGAWPAAVFIRTGGGGDRPLVDRGVRDADGNSLIAGDGPARELAAIGWAGVQVDGPLGGLRNPDGSDEQFLVFNITNPDALRDNVRQSALELALLPPMLSQWSFDGSACPGAGDVAFAPDLALIGHSMGATIGPGALAQAPEYRYAVWSGGGGSYIANVMWKELPLHVRPVAESILGYTVLGRELDEHDPVLTLVQWAAESADPPVFASAFADRHTLMVQGIVDHYIMPPIANTLSWSASLTRVGPGLDEVDPEVAGLAPWSEYADLVGGSSVSDGWIPTSGPTRAVVQYASDGVEDGHEVFFQRRDARSALRCFLGTARAGDGTVAREGCGL